MRLPKDLLSGRYKKPNIYLCETDKTKMCRLGTFNTSGTFKFNGLSELSFEVSRVYTNMINGEREINLYYDKIEAPRLILLDGFGYFEIQTVELASNGIEERKVISANSSEYVLSTKYLENFYINTGEAKSVEVIYNEKHGGNLIPVTLYNPSKPELSLMHLILEEVYGWKIGHVPASLATLSRQFEIDRESVYDFLMNEICEKFNCYVVFDTMNNEINIYAESLTSKFIGDGKTNTFIISPPFAKIGTVSVDGYKTTRWVYNPTTGALTLEDVPGSDARIEVVDGALTEWETDVVVSFDNLAQEVNVNYSMDDIKTRLTVTYGDDLDIREANLGLPYLTDLSYYYHPDWMGQDLYDAYGTYMKKSNEQQAAYTANSQEILKWSDYIAYEEHRLSLEYSEAIVSAETVGTYYTRQKNLDGSYYYSEVSLPSEYKADVKYYSNLTTNVNETKVENLYTALKSFFHAFFTSDEDKKIEALDTISELDEFDFMETYTVVYLHDGLNNATEIEAMDAVVKNFLGEIWGELGRTPLKQLYLASYKKKQEVGVESGHADENSNEYGNYYPVVLFIDSIESAIKKRDDAIAGYKANQTVYQEANKAINEKLSMRENFTDAQLIRLSSFLREDELHLDDIVETSLTDTADSFKTKQDAMESGRIELQKICQPRLQFSMTMANIYALPEFEPIIDQFKLGNVIRIYLRPDYPKQSRLLQVNINFDDFSDFSCEFGELTGLLTQSDIHADLLSNAISAGKSVATNSSYWSRGSDIATATDLKIQQGLLDATTQIKSIDGDQGVVIDKYGVHLTKVDPKTGEIDDKQGWIVNNKFLYSDDGFKTTKSVFGEYTIGEKTYWGLLAEAVMAGYIEGSTIVGGSIASTNYKSSDTGAGAGTYIDLLNGGFDFAGGKIVYDTDSNVLTLKNVTIEWSSLTDKPEVKDISGLEEYVGKLDDFKTKADDAYELADSAKEIAENAQTIGDNLVNGLGFQETEITGKYVISPVIAGGTLLIGDKSGTHAQITTEGKLICTGADISGDIVANSLTLGNDVKISTDNINGLSSVATSGNYDDLTNRPTIPTSVQDLGFDTSDIIYKGDVVQTTKTDSNGISYVETSVPSLNGVITYSTYDANDYIVFGRSKGTNSDGNNYVCINKDGLLTARNALIYGTVYATDGEFIGKVTATSGEIGGWTIEDGYIHTGDIGRDGSAFLAPNGRLSDTTHHIGGSTTQHNWTLTVGSTFGVTYDGKLYTNAAKIGGWNIDNNGMYVSTFKISSLTSAENQTIVGHSSNKWRILAGDSDGYNFGVTEDGMLCAKNAKIAGVLSAGRDSSLGEFKVDNNSIFSGSEWDWENDTAPQVFMCTGSKNQYKIAGKKQNGWAFGAGKNFGVDSDGKLYASAGNIGGWNIGSITIKNGEATVYSGMALYSDPHTDPHDSQQTNISVALTQKELFVYGEDEKGTKFSKSTSWSKIIRAANA